MRILALAILAAAAALPAQTADDNPYGHSRHGEAFDDGPRQAAYLMAGMSAQVHLPVSGLSHEAQAFFDQGVTQQHGFWYFESERSFRQVAMLQPDCAMAYWGMAMANVENKKRAAGFIAHAVERSAKVPEYERLWIDALATYHQIDAACRAELQSGDKQRTDKARADLVKKNEQRDEQKLGRQLVRDFEALVFAFPDDLEAKAFLELQVWLNYDWGSGIPITSHGAEDALLSQILAKAPLHPVHHYRVHLWDQEKPERAIASAALIGHSAPGIAHQWHMAGHIYDKLGRYADAAWQQEASSRVDHAHMQRDHVMPFLIHNYGHNQEWLCRSLLKIGRVHEALDLAKNLVELPRHPDKNKIEDQGSIAGYGRQRLLDVCSTYELWPELREACSQGFVEVTGKAVPDGRRLLGLGTAAFRMGDLEAGAKALHDFDQLLQLAQHERAEQIDQAEAAALARDADHGAVAKATAAALESGSGAVRQVRELLAQLRAEQALAQRDGKAALQAIKGMDAPAPLRAAIHAVLGEHDQAITVLQQDQEAHQHQVPPLARLILALHAGGKQQAARTRFDELRQLAGHADLDVPLLQQLAPIAAEFGCPTDWRQPQPPAADTLPEQRPALDSLGPFRWSPWSAVGFDLAGADGARHRPADHQRPTLVVFYLGFGCLHCVEQLRALAPQAAAFAAAGIDIVAIGTDTAANAAQSLANMAAGERFPFPLLADPELKAFKAWRCHDDFESLPLHGTFLVDTTGKVRWQDISFEPFTKIEWLLHESQRLLGMPAGAGSR
jgi:peroxiredoxin